MIQSFLVLLVSLPISFFSRVVNLNADNDIYNNTKFGDTAAVL